MDSIKLICFDLDLTLITHNSWLELNKALGVSLEEDAKLFNYYTTGKITYQEWNDKIVEHYQKHHASTKFGITEILSKYTYAEGAKDVIAYLKEKGYVVALVSGSIHNLVEMIARDLGIEHFKAHNTLVFDQNEKLTAITAAGSDVSGKVKYLEAICTELGIGMTECACVGDGANDIKMFQKTGHGITFRGSPIESEAWKVIDTLDDLKTIFT